ncbi:integrase [Thalassobacillus pellis]|uniref:integrase n=1 Tax=Thalassobacillus pellis TaxID=748008 RepID=UPI00195FF9BB|nr:integrase [Thalassobacillus pellis]MBM7552596.1 hypothetical protein [Thalassobacillus pellis]
MKKRALKKKIKKLIHTTVDQAGLHLPIRHKRTNINMSYDFIEDAIYFDIRRLVKARKEMTEIVPIEIYVQTLTLHELGHQLDREALLASIPRTIEILKAKRKHPMFERRKNINLFKIDMEAHEMDYTFEETGWENAEKLNRLHNIVEWDSFEKVKKNSLLTYTVFYNRDLLIYQQLLKEQQEEAAG